MLPIQPAGACTFAEDPSLDALHARIFWTAQADLAVVSAAAEPARSGRDCFDPAELAEWLTLLRSPRGEHLLLSDGFRRIRIDIREGSLLAPQPLRLVFRVEQAGLADNMVTLRQLLPLLRSGRWPALPNRHAPIANRQIKLIRTCDALASGASQRDIAMALFGVEGVAAGWNGCSDFLRSRTRRLVRGARAMAAGGYRQLLGGSL